MATVRAPKKAPSNKKDGLNYLTKNFTKDELAERCAKLQEEKAVETVKFLELEKEFDVVKKELDNLKKQYKRLSIKKERVKMVLELKAMNKVPVEIRDRLALRGFDISLDEIKSVFFGDLNLEEQSYYQECVDKYIETIRINTKYYKQSSVEEQNKLLGYAYENLENHPKEDTLGIQKILDSISSMITKRDTLMKNIDEHKEETEEDKALSITTTDFKEMSDKIINIGAFKVKAIGGDK